MFFLFILIFLIVLILAIHTSKIEIEIKDLEINTEKPKGEKINQESEIYVYLLIFQKIKLFKKDIKNMKFQNKDIDIKTLKNNDIKIYYKEFLQNIKQIELYMQIGTQDAALTAVLTGVTASILGIILKKPKYEVIPIYSNKNLLKIKLNCIISVYLMQYIYKLISDKIKNFGKNNSIKTRKSIQKKVEV